MQLAVGLLWRDWQDTEDSAAEYNFTLPNGKQGAIEGCAYLSHNFLEYEKWMGLVADTPETRLPDDGNKTDPDYEADREHDIREAMKEYHTPLNFHLCVSSSGC